MNLDNMLDALDTALPDDLVVQYCRILLEQIADVDGIHIELEDSSIIIPHHPEIIVVTKTFVRQYYDVGFGTGFRVQVAIGGIDHIEYGILYAKYCFATFYYNDQFQLITEDFYKDMR